MLPIRYSMKERKQKENENFEESGTQRERDTGEREKDNLDWKCWLGIKKGKKPFP